MKERIVIDNEDILFSCLHDYEDNVGVINYKLDRKKFEQVPETFEDVKQLTKELIEKLKLNKEIWEIKEICFTSVGNMVSNNGWDLLMTNLTPPRQWNIIKSLIGEE